MSRRLRFFAAAALATMLGTAACSHAPAPAATTPDPHALPSKPAKPALDRAKLRAALAARRDVTFARFLAYREARVYPENTYDAGYEHVWLDEQGRLCAAATIVAGDWGRDISARVALEDNFIRLYDVHDGELYDWMLTSGMTQAEIDAIQVPGWNPGPRGGGEEISPVPGRVAEIERLYERYTGVELQLRAAWDTSLDAATDLLMQRPALARALISSGGAVGAGPGHYAGDATASASASPSGPSGSGAGAPRAFAAPPR